MNNDIAKKISLTLSRTDFPVGVEHSDGVIHRSGRQGVIAKVHAICDAYSAKGKSRADILARCKKLGIADGTARTQYDRWRSPPKAKASKKVAK